MPRPDCRRASASSSNGAMMVSTKRPPVARLTFESGPAVISIEPPRRLVALSRLEKRLTVCATSGGSPASCARASSRRASAAWPCSASKRPSSSRARGVSDCSASNSRSQRIAPSRSPCASRRPASRKRASARYSGLGSSSARSSSSSAPAALPSAATSFSAARTIARPKRERRPGRRRTDRPARAAASRRRPESEG